MDKLTLGSRYRFWWSGISFFFFLLISPDINNKTIQSSRFKAFLSFLLDSFCNLGLHFKDLGKSTRIHRLRTCDENNGYQQITDESEAKNKKNTPCGSMCPPPFYLT